MATIGTSYLTMADWAKRQDPSGKTSAIVELLHQQNSALDDILYKEGNLPTGEQTTIRTGLPTVYYRMINAGVPNSKSTTAQVVENAAILEARSAVDKDEAELNGDVNAFRISESMAFLEAMRQKQATTLIYGTAANPEEYVGFAARYSLTTAANGQNIISAGGSGSDNTSIFLVNWGENKVFGVFPKGSMAGLQHEDLGLDDQNDGDGNPFRAYKDRYVWKMGLVVKDWREVVRIPNIDVSDLASLATTQAITASTAIVKLMARAIDRLPNGPSGKPVFYANRTVASHLRVMALEKSSSAVTIEQGLNQFGNTIMEMRFLGIPVRIMDAIANDEAVVS